MDKFNIEMFSKGELQSREPASTATEAIEKLASMLTEELEYIVRDDKGIRLSIMELKKLAAQEVVRFKGAALAPSAASIPNRFRITAVGGLAKKQKQGT